jgi:hypothetical protein
MIGYSNLRSPTRGVAGRAVEYLVILRDAGHDVLSVSDNTIDNHLTRLYTLGGI